MSDKMLDSHDLDDYYEGLMYEDGTIDPYDIEPDDWRDPDVEA